MRGQANLELALCLPVLVLLAFGAVVVVRAADARAGLDQATAAAAAVAARAPDAGSGTAAAQATFAAIAAGYPLTSPELTLSLGGFDRGGTLVATGSALVGVDLVPAPGLPRSLRLTSSARSQIQPWRSRP